MPANPPRFINPSSLPEPSGYNNGVLRTLPGGGGLLFLAGQVGWDEHGRIVSERLADQFDRALANLLTVVRAAGGEPSSIGQLTIFVTDKNAYLAARKEIGQAYRRHMGRHYPAMSLVEVGALVDPGAHVEIQGIALV